MPEKCDGCSLCQLSEGLATSHDMLVALDKVKETKETEKEYNKIMRQIRKRCPEKCH